MPEKRIKAQIRRRFSAAVPVYDRWAAAQGQAAGYLLNLLPEKRFGRVLDIGCGTGLLVAGLLEAGRAGAVTGIDFAPNMVAACRRRWPEHRFVCADAEEFGPSSRYDLILSNFTFQWLENIPGAVAKYFSCLAPGGVLALAVPVSGSLRELRTSALAANGKPLHLLDFPDRNVLESAFQSVAGCPYLRELREVTAWFDTPLASLRSLKGIGASFGGGEVYTVAQMRRLLQEYEKAFAVSGLGCPVSYRVWFGVAEKTAAAER
ncbi:MAG: methyltransferase domain-containing protein [Deltaproteobacteria bacterium]|nr:methyltransferase domain-containing protein [Deltaproteobacteria bacterium]